MARYKETENVQGLFLAVNLKEQILPETFEWTINYLIDQMDMTSFDKNYKNDRKGAAAYSPKILLKIILYCYSKGIITSRRIERTCKENIIAKALAEDAEPDHDTIAAFISSNEEEVKDLFMQILLQCSELKLITGEMFAVDGCKLPSNASKEWSGTFTELSKKAEKLKKYIAKIMSRHKELDKNKEAKTIRKKYRKTLGDDKERTERGIERMKRKLKKINKFLKESKPKMGTRYEVQTNITDEESSLIKSPHGYIQGYNGVAAADSANQVIVCAEAAVSESGSFPQILDKIEENMKAVTGKDEPLKGALIEGDTGFFSEGNLQEAAKREIEVIIPDPQFRQRDPYFTEKKAEKAPDRKRTFTQDDFDYDENNDSYICPAGKVLEHKSNAKIRDEEWKRYKAKIGDCRNCGLKEKCINKRTESKNSIKTLCIYEKRYEENLTEKMREKIDNPVYRELYSRRMQIIEPVFSDITYCKKMNRFTLRTLKKVNIQWQLYCIVHNIGKCIKPLSEKLAV